MSKLFGTDGIRGIAGQWPLTKDFVERVGTVSGHVLKKHFPQKKASVLIVRDTRQSGVVLQKSLSRGLQKAGIRSYDAGVLPTPAVSALLPRYSFLAGAVISASHNPAEFNGIKFFQGDGTKLSESIEKKIEKFSVSQNGICYSQEKSLFFKKASQDYLQFLKEAWPKGFHLRGMRIVIDCAHGATYQTATILLRSLGAQVTTLGVSPNGKNINQGCGSLFPQRLSRVVRQKKAHLGVAFDGDGDRAIFVDETGTKQDGDSVLIAAARFLKQAGRLKKNKVIVTIMTNLGLIRGLDALGIETEETSVGDKYVWEALSRTGAVLGGEPSGHIIFREFLPTGDGLLTALQILNILRQTDQPLSSLSSLAARFPQVLLNVPVREKKALNQLAPFQKEVLSVKKYLGNKGRVIIRYSGTEPLLRIMIEGPMFSLINRQAHGLANIIKRMKI